MDDITAAEIRKWAWEQYRDAVGRVNGDPITFSNRMRVADELAAWLMSGKLPKDLLDTATQ